MPRARHPSKEIEAALCALEELGWQVSEAKGRSAHAWGFVRCPENAKDQCRGGIFCQMQVWSTPKVPQKHARELLRKAQGCVLAKDHDDEQ